MTCIPEIKSYFYRKKSIPLVPPLNFQINTIPKSGHFFYFAYGLNMNKKRYINIIMTILYCLSNISLLIEFFFIYLTPYFSPALDLKFS